MWYFPCNDRRIASCRCIVTSGPKDKAYGYEPAKMFDAPHRSGYSRNLTLSYSCGSLLIKKTLQPTSTGRSLPPVSSSGPYGHSDHTPSPLLRLSKPTSGTCADAIKHIYYRDEQLILFVMLDFFLCRDRMVSEVTFYSYSCGHIVNIQQV